MKCKERKKKRTENLRSELSVGPVEKEEGTRNSKVKKSAFITRETRKGAGDKRRDVSRVKNRLQGLDGDRKSGSADKTRIQNGDVTNGRLGKKINQVNI